MGESVRPGILVLVNNTDWELTGPSPLSLSSRRSPYLLCERSHRDRDDTHRTFFLTLEDQRESGDYRGPEVHSFPVLRSHSFVRRVSRSCSFVSRSPFRVLQFSSNFFLVRRPPVAVRSEVRGIRRETVAFDWKNTGDYGSVADVIATSSTHFLWALLFLVPRQRDDLPRKRRLLLGL